MTARQRPDAAPASKHLLRQALLPMLAQVMGRVSGGHCCGRAEARAAPSRMAVKMLVECMMYISLQYSVSLVGDKMGT